MSAKNLMSEWLGKFADIAGCPHV